MNDYLGNRMKGATEVYILENWVNDDFVSNYLRFINRENKIYLISDVQRTVRSYDEEPRKMVHVYKWATKFFKDNSETLITKILKPHNNERRIRQAF